METPIQSVQRSLNLLFRCTLFLMFPHFQKYLNLQVRTKKLVNSVVYHTCPSRLVSRVHPFIFFKLAGVVSLSRIRWIFSDLYIPPCVGKIFQFMMLTFLENALNLYIFTHAPVPRSKLQVDEMGGGNYNFVYKNSVRKYEHDLEH